MRNNQDNEDTLNKQLTLEEIGSYKRNIKVDISIWNILKNLKGNNETFNDVVSGLLKQKTQSIGKENMKLIKYHRKVLFIKTGYSRDNLTYSHSIGIEFEYNDIKNNVTDFVLDVRIKKIFFKKQILNPSEFFGLDSDHKHLYHTYLNLHLKCIALALDKELKIHTRMYEDRDFEDIALWRKVYYDYNLSEDSFINDIQEPLRLSEQDASKEKYIKDIESSMAYSIWK